MIIGFIILVNIVIRWIFSLRNNTNQISLTETTKLLYLWSYREALDNIDILIKSDPNNPDLLAQRCTIFGKLGDIQNTTKCMDRLSKLSRDPIYLQIYKTILLIQNTDYQWAQIYLNSMNTSGATMDELVSMWAGINAYFLQDMTWAINHLDSAIANDVNNPYALYYRWLIEQSNKNWNASLKYFDRAEKNGISEPDFLYDKGYSLARTNHWEDAIKYFDQLIKINSHHVLALYQRGYAFYRLEKYDEALKSYDLALEVEAENYEVLYEKGNVLFKLGNYQDAIGLYDQSLAVISGNRNINTYGQKLLSYYILKDNNAIDLLKAEIDEIIPTNARGNVMMWNNYSQMWKYNDAIDYFNHAIELNPEYKLIYDGMFNNLIRQTIQLDRETKYIDADNMIDQTISLRNGEYSGNNNIWFFKWLTALLNNNRNSAEKHFQTIWGWWYAPEDMDIVLALRNIWEGKFDEAQTLLGNFDKAYPNHTVAPHLRVLLLTKMAEAGKLDPKKDYFVTDDKKSYDDPTIQQAMKDGLRKYNDYFKRYWEL